MTTRTRAAGQAPGHRAPILIAIADDQCIAIVPEFAPGRWHDLRPRLPYLAGRETRLAGRAAQVR